MTHAQQLIRRLIDEAKMSPATIAEALDDRVSARTIYRWMEGSSEPQQKADMVALERLHEAKFAATPNPDAPRAA